MGTFVTSRSPSLVFKRLWKNTRCTHSTGEGLARGSQTGVCVTCQWSGSTNERRAKKMWAPLNTKASDSAEILPKLTEYTSMNPFVPIYPKLAQIKFWMPYLRFAGIWPIAWCAISLVQAHPSNYFLLGVKRVSHFGAGIWRFYNLSTLSRAVRKIWDTFRYQEQTRIDKTEVKNVISILRDLPGIFLLLSLLLQMRELF